MRDEPGEDALDAAARAVAEAEHAVALTGAGVSVESGIPDFRSPGGLWSIFDPFEYATLSCFLEDPEKAWRLYRALGTTLAGRKPNAAHGALAALERANLLHGVITQNIDSLHQAAGSRRVFEIHGESGHLRCLGCGRLERVLPSHLEPGPVPRCGPCGWPLKPDIVLFEEDVREMDAIEAILEECDLLLLVGTSAEVSPASLLPGRVLHGGGSLIEFNLGQTRLTRSGLGPRGVWVEGPVGMTLPLVAARALHILGSRGGP